MLKARYVVSCPHSSTERCSCRERASSTWARSSRRSGTRITRRRSWSRRTGLTIEDGSGGRTRVRAAVIPPRMPHEHGPCSHAAFIYLDGDDVGEPRARAQRRAAVRDVAARHARRRRPAGSDAGAGAHPDRRDPRRARRAPAAEAVASGDAANVRVPRPFRRRRSRAAVPRSGLSPRQMRHAFARDVGLPMRAYVRWKRVRRAVAAVEKGANLSAAAAAAGFADSAHLSRVFRAQFGMTPSQGLRSIRWRTLD